MPGVGYHFVRQVARTARPAAGTDACTDFKTPSHTEERSQLEEHPFKTKEEVLNSTKHLCCDRDLLEGRCMEEQRVSSVGVRLPLNSTCLQGKVGDIFRTLFGSKKFSNEAAGGNCHRHNNQPSKRAPQIKQQQRCLPRMLCASKNTNP